MSRYASLCWLAAVLGCGGNGPPIVLATTTSMANSGLLDRILPAYTDTVRTAQVGSGLALTMLARNHADVAISHAPQREAETLVNHPHWFYRKILFNDFLIVGPADDPAGIAGMADAVAGMTQIAACRCRFISRGDESGTHERERELWALANVTVSGGQVVAAGAGMGQTLRVASETNAYTLTDRGTFEMLSSALRLRPLVAGDPRLLNTYAVIADPANSRGFAFARWLADGAGRRALENTLSSGAVRGFSPWPPGRDASKPGATPFE